MTSAERSLLHRCEQNAVPTDADVRCLCECLVKNGAQKEAADFVSRKLSAADALDLGRRCFGEYRADVFRKINDRWRCQKTVVGEELLTRFGVDMPASASQQLDLPLKAAGRSPVTGTVSPAPSKPSSIPDKTLRTIRAELETVKAENSELSQARTKLMQERDSLRKELDARFRKFQDLQAQLESANEALQQKVEDTRKLEEMTKILALDLQTERQHVEEERNEKERCEELLPPYWQEVDSRLAVEGEEPCLRRRTFLAYAAFVSGLSSQEDGFVSKFKWFDAELSDIYSEDSNGLVRKRERIQNYLNEVVTSCSIRWDLQGEQFNAALHWSASQTGTHITSVKTALILNSDGSVKNRATVVTG